MSEYVGKLEEENDSLRTLVQQLKLENKRLKERESAAKERWGSIEHTNFPEEDLAKIIEKMTPDRPPLSVARIRNTEFSRHQGKLQPKYSVRIFYDMATGYDSFWDSMGIVPLDHDKLWSK